MLINAENNSALFALGVLGTDAGELEVVTVRAGTPGTPGPVILDLTGKVFERSAELGFGGVVETKLNAEQIEAIEKSGSYVSVTTSAGTMIGQLTDRSVSR